LFIFHLPGDYRDSDLMRLFIKFGDLISAHVVTGTNGFSKGFGKPNIFLLFLKIKMSFKYLQQDL